MPRRIPIRIKLAAALTVPISALLLVSILEVRQGAAEQRETRSQTELATASIGPGGVITTLQNERNFGSVWLLGFEGTLQLPVTSFEGATAATDEAIAAFREDIRDKGSEVRQAFEPVLADIESQLAPLREVVTTYDGERSLETQPISDPFFSDYTGLIDQLFAANGQSALSIDDPTLRRGVELTDLATNQIEYVARLTRVLLLAGVSEGQRLDEPSEIAGAAGLLGQVENGVQLLNQLGTGRFRGPAEKVDGEFRASGYTDLAHEAIDTGRVRVTDTMASLSREDDEGYNGFRTTVNDEIEARADTLNDEVNADRVRYMLLGAMALVVAGLVTWLVSRSITRPLRSLTRQAKDMAEERLPAAVTDILETPLGEDVQVPSVEPIRVQTRDEVSDVADALNTVQDSALDLAVEQAVLRRNIADSFVNLGRRNQNLLGRQLDFITELESNETNADTLANLFRLDHLATRMRRNAESLLVLAGIEPPRQWAAPVRLTDVIRAALGEVEDYQRVTVRGVEPATIIGSAAADLAHLLAELIENALVFSPPDQSVDIRGRANPRGYTLAVIDSGLGMPAGDIAAANRRLAGAESFTIAPSKYLGHYVAGNLAARHDIRVTLDNSPGNGVTATVEVPPSLLTADDEVLEPEATPDARGLADAGAFGVMPALVAGPEPRGGDDAGAEGVDGGGPWAPPPAHDVPSREVPAAPVLDPALLESLSALGGRAPDPTGPALPSGPTPPAPSRTASGLVKRSRRESEPAPSAVMPDGELLANLSSVADHLGRRSSGTVPEPAARDHRRPTNPWTPPSRQDAPRSWPAPPGFDGPSSSPLPPAPRTGRPPLPVRGNGGRPPATRPGPPPAPGPAPAPSGDEGGSTQGGLTRRVRGAQLPATQPLHLRRHQDHPLEAPGGYRLGGHHDAHGHELGNGHTNGHSNRPANGRHGGPASGGTGGHDNSAADSVYGFLTSFTQGVQRGLDETRRDPNGPKENQ